MNRAYTLFLPLLLLVMLISACGAYKNYKKAEKYFALGEYFDAANEYKHAYRGTSPKEHARRGMLSAKMAYCYDRTNQIGKAEASYRNAIRYGQASLENRLAFAKVLLKGMKYKEAEAQFQLLLDTLAQVPKDNGTEPQLIGANMDHTPLTPAQMTELARNGLITARQAPAIKEQGSRYTVKRMDIFNSRRSDYSPALLGDNADYLYFTSTRNEAQGNELSGITGTKPGDIFYSEKDDKGKWSRPEPVEGGLNTEADEGAGSFSPDGREMYLTLCGTDPSYPRYAQIVKSNRSDASWGKASEVKLTADTLSSYAHPAVSPDGEWLYFTSDMPGGKGGLDIWRVRITSAGLGGVENLGDPVNTPGDEMFPAFRPNGDFYFSSNGHPGLGGLDIFIAKVDKSRHYRLEHPGYPLNSAGDDFGPTFEGPHNKGFFSSNRGDARGFDHIYSFENPEIVQTVKGWVYEMDGYELPAAQVYIIGDDGTNEKVGLRGDGSFTKVVKPGVSYLFLANCKGYLNHKEELTVQPTQESEETVLQFPLASITAPVLIDNIFYDFDKATLRPESEKSLDELVKLLNENPNVTIELSAHCDYKGSAAYNKNLSQRRAESVVSYLISKGIATDRLTPVGYGKDNPKKVRRKMTEKYPWLPTDSVLTEDFIKHLKDTTQQEVCNQLNRRTEFIVLRTTYGMFDEKGQLKEQPKNRKKEEEPVNDDDGFDIIMY